MNRKYFLLVFLLNFFYKTDAHTYKIDSGCVYVIYTFNKQDNIYICNAKNVYASNGIYGLNSWEVLNHFDNDECDDLYSLYHEYLNDKFSSERSNPFFNPIKISQNQIPTSVYVAKSNEYYKRDKEGAFRLNKIDENDIYLSFQVYGKYLIVDDSSGRCGRHELPSSSYWFADSYMTPWLVFIDINRYSPLDKTVAKKMGLKKLPPKTKLKIIFKDH